MNRVDRLLAMILHLQTRRVVTAESLAEHFELSVRTVYRDLAALAEAGVPVYAEAGVGYSLLKGYHLPPVNFTEHEASALHLAALLTAQFGDAATQANVESALRKMSTVLPERLREQNARLQQAMATIVAPLPPGASLLCLQQALSRREVLSIRYQTPGQPEAERCVEPQGLVYYGDRWHLIAWCRLRQQQRDFRTDRIVDMQGTGEFFIPRETFNAQQFMQKCCSPTALVGQLLFTPTAADRAAREWWLGAESETPREDGIELTLATHHWDHLAQWLLGFGTEVRVLGPEPLRLSLRMHAERTLAHHFAGAEATSAAEVEAVIVAPLSAAV